MLNLLTIWFRHGVVPEVHDTLVKGEANIWGIYLDYWLGVVPQLIACIHHKDPNSRDALHRLLMKLGEKHPQVDDEAVAP